MNSKQAHELELTRYILLNMPSPPGLIKNIEDMLSIYTRESKLKIT